MQADARLVHDEERIDKRRSETCGKVDTLHFAAAQRARRAIQGQITDANFAKIIESRANFVPQHFRCRVVRQDVDPGEKIARIGNGERRELRKSQKNFGSRIATSGDFVIQRFRLKAPAIAARAFRVSAITAEQDAHMHFVCLALEPSEKSADAVPPIVLVIFIVVITAFLSVDHEVLIRFRQFLEWNVDVDLFARAGSKQIFLRFTKLGTAKGPHHALLDGQAAIRNCTIEIKRNGATESAAFGTGTERIVETKEAWSRRPNVEIAMRAMPAGGERHC